MKPTFFQMTGWLMLPALLVAAGCADTSTTPQAKAPAKQAKLEPAQAKAGPTTGPPRQTGQVTQQGSGGAVQSVRGAVKRVADMEDLKNFALAYNIYFNEHGRGPSRVEDLGRDIPQKMVAALQANDVYVVTWKLSNLSSNTIVAYAKEPDMYGMRLVAKGDGSVVRMNSTEFEQAKGRQ